MRQARQQICQRGIDGKRCGDRQRLAGRVDMRARRDGADPWDDPLKKLAPAPLEAASDMGVATLSSPYFKRSRRVASVTATISPRNPFASWSFDWGASIT
ncbi:hypothetical protein BN2475_550030 [Paraburkholderia ribeironis]|uniref:Uncharacterized protein n=1 Tax=Paraburkholderia ribeironis TaxID=1247936 RepID=A0A1N7SDE7_9BURK|nr:hypothetical protein BN2475_550030 [Paraburkholderia ribeironis]